MKQTKTVLSAARLITALSLAAAVALSAAGCTRRGNEGSTPSTAPELASDLESGAEALQDDVEEGLSKAEDALDPSREDGSSSSESESPDSESESSGSESDASEESAAPAMSADFSEIGALDATLENGFPGGPVDDRNRPSGPVSYQAKYGQYDAHFIVPDSDKIYLTFDEGYENGYTSRILDTLKEKNVKAVFFITYPYAKSEPALVKRMIDEGHTIGNHSTAHKVYPSLPLSEAANDLMTLHEYVKSQYGYEMFLFRPPEGAFSEQTLALAQSLGYKTMLWSFAYKDYDVNSQPISVEAIDTIVSKAHPGEIALLHAVSKTNTEVLGDVIDQIRGKGYEFADYFSLYSGTAD